MVQNQKIIIRYLYNNFLLVPTYVKLIIFINLQLIKIIKTKMYTE